MVYSLDLNFIPVGVPQIVKLSQYDNEIPEIQVTLWNGTQGYTIPTGAECYIAGTKPDGTGFEYACTWNGSVVTVEITEQMTAVAGRVLCEIIVRKDGRKGTENFFLDVEPCALSSDVIPSETDIPIIEQIPEIRNECQEYADKAHQWATYGDDEDTPSAINNAKHWAEQSQIYAQGALHWKGSIPFASIPSSGLTTGDYYNVTDNFITDNRFVEGAGVECGAGTNIVWNGSLWDIPVSVMFASQINYDNTASGLTATKVQGAIDEIQEEIGQINTSLIEINSNLSDIGTTTSLAVGSIGGSGTITHPDLSTGYKAIIVLLRSGTSIVASALCPISGWLGGNNYYVQFYDEANTRHMTMYFTRTTDTSTYLTLVSPENYFSGWSYQIIGVK